jgi:DsbC/DsbD-like thiol-disulfide interchange protein
VIGISYDSIEDLKSFSEKHQISYPLLSDVGSKVIKKYGILNTNDDSGIPNPGIYIIDKNLKVLSKQFEKPYTARPTAESVLAIHLKEEIQSNIHQFRTSYMTGSIAISDTLAYTGQVLAITIKFKLDENWHIYGKPIPDGYIPLTIDFEPNPNISLDSFEFPNTTKITLESINETFSILPGEFTLKSFLRIDKRPQFGSYLLNISIKFQACDNKICMPPEEIKFQFPLIIKKSNI